MTVHDGGSDKDWTLGTLHLHLAERISDVVVASRDRLIAVDLRIAQLWSAHEAAHVEIDRRYDERMNALRRSMENLSIAEKERWEAGQLTFHAAVVALEKSVGMQIHTADVAVLKAENANEKRFDSVNEFRAALSDQTARLMPRIEVDNRIAALSEKINDMGARLDRADGKGIGIAAIWGVILGGAGLLGIIATVILNVARIGH